jgi:hypothetical protein
MAAAAMTLRASETALRPASFPGVSFMVFPWEIYSVVERIGFDLNCTGGNAESRESRVEKACGDDSDLYPLLVRLRL